MLRRVEQGEAYAGLALAGELERAGLSPQDRGLATELVYGVLRHRLRLDRALAAYAARGLGKLPVPVLEALRVGAYQLMMSRVPAHAAVDDAVAAVRAIAGDKVGGFANAVLRKLAAEGEPAPPPATDVFATCEAVWSLPRWVTEALRAVLPADEIVRAAEAFAQPAPVVLRTRTAKVRAGIIGEVRAARPDASVEPSPVAPEAIIVRGGGAPETLEVFMAGRVTVQDVGAQRIAHLLGPKDGDRILDAASGVGGKALHMADLAPGAQIDAADTSRRKLDLAEDSARRLGVTTVHAIEVDLTAPGDAIAPTYDKILLDAPCTGLGVLRRHPEAKWRRRPADVTRAAVLQAQLLDTLASRLAPGGALVYAVCSFTREETTAVIDAFLARTPGFVLEETVRTWPHRDDADAFFAARLRRAPA